MSSHMELPETFQDLLKNLGRAQLAYSYRISFGENAPQSLFTSERTLQAGQDWCKRRAQGLLLLSIVATRTHALLQEQGYKAAVHAFLVQLAQEPSIVAAIRTPRYLYQLICSAIEDVEQFEQVLSLLQQFKRSGR